MKLLAPAVYIVAFSLLLYKTREVWPKDEYTVSVEASEEVKPKKRPDTLATRVAVLDDLVARGRISQAMRDVELTHELMTGQVGRNFSSPPEN